MAGLTINSETIDKYFSFLKRLDDDSKKKIIRRLTETLDIEESTSHDISSLFGAWKDDKSSDEIIKEIRESRVENQDIEEFS